LSKIEHDALTNAGDVKYHIGYSADTATPDDAVQTVPAGEESPTHFEWD